MKSIQILFFGALILLSWACKTLPESKSPLQDEEVKKRHYAKSYHANEANRVVDIAEDNKGKRQRYQSKQRKRQQEELESLNKKDEKKSKAVPFTIY